MNCKLFFVFFGVFLKKPSASFRLTRMPGFTSQIAACTFFRKHLYFKCKGRLLQRVDRYPFIVCVLSLGPGAEGTYLGMKTGRRGGHLA